jgi:hypothetical protein
MSDREDLLTRFLLGAVDERERAEVEDRLLSDDEFYERMLAGEGDLMDAYVRDELSSSERVQFEKSFLSSARRRERVEFAQGLMESATQLHETKLASPRAHVRAESSRRKGFLASLLSPRPALGYALAAAALVVVALTVWIAVERMRARVEPQQVQTEGDAPQIPKEGTQVSGQNESRVASRQPDEGTPAQESVNATPRVRQTPAREEQATRPVFAVVTLVPGSLRDGTAGANLFIPRMATHVRVRMQLEVDAYRSYRAIVSTPEGRSVWAGAASKDRQKNAQFVTLTLAAGSLARGDYIIELTGAIAGGRSAPAAHYSFRVTRED